MSCDAGWLGLATDLYQLTMGATYLARAMDETATFSLFVRKLPRNRAYLVAAGLADALSRLAAFGFDARAADYLRSIGRLREEDVRRLVATRFRGDVWAVSEGRVVFGGEPLLEVQARLCEAQLVESTLLNAIHYPTLVASKAARCVAAAGGAVLVDFGMRRTPGIEASLSAARAAYLAGFAATSNLLAGRELGIPVSGTVAHSLIEVSPNEVDAFRRAADTALGGVTLLVDTYDTLVGVRHAIQIAKELERDGRRVDAVRLDSGDLATLAVQARRMLDEAGLPAVRIFASGGLDEVAIARLRRARAPLDGYGVGTKLGMSADAPALDMAYKVVAYGQRPSLKLSEGKGTLVGPKQVWRRREGSGRFAEDRIGARDEPRPGPDWEPLLEPVMEQGRPCRQPSLSELRTLHRHEMQSVPPELLDPESEVGYRVEVSAELARRQRVAVEDVRRREEIG